jgi:iron complex transport system ATP-binding protein
MFTVQGLSVSLDEKAVVDNVSLDLNAGEVLGLLGPNGAGKSSLLKSIVGLLPSSGRLTLDEQPWLAQPPAYRARMMAYLSQSDTVTWPLTVERVVGLGRIPHEPESSMARRSALDRVFEETELSALRSRSIADLSGGERARVLIARCFAVEAEYVLADEPIAGLDPFHQLQFMELFAARARAGAGVLLVLHDLSLAARFCDRVVLMRDGQILGQGTPAETLLPALLEDVYQVEFAGDVNACPPSLIPDTRL